MYNRVKYMLKKSFQNGKKFNYKRRRFSTFPKNPNPNSPFTYITAAFICGVYYKIREEGDPPSRI